MRFSGNGCQPCRDSRKKCDGSKPTCSRCLRSGKQCFGHREPFSIICSENNYASRQRNRPRGGRPVPEFVVNIGTPIARDVPSEALAYYMHYHVLPVEGTSREPDNLREALQSAWTTSPAVELAVSSLAMAIFSKVKHLPNAAPHALISYQKSLQSLQEALPTVCGSNVDACLLTICFLVHYEDAIHPPSFSDSSQPVQSPQSQLHRTGITAVLKNWVTESSSRKAPTYSIKYARRFLRKTALLGQADLPEWLIDGALFGECGREQELDGLLARLVSVRGQMCSPPETKTLPQPGLQDVLSVIEKVEAETLAIDESLLAWMQVYPPHTVHRLADERIWSNVNFHHSCVYTFPDLAQAAVQIQCCGFRVLATHWRIRALEILQKYCSSIAVEKLNKCRSTMASLAYDLSSAVPFCLGRFTVSTDPGRFKEHIEIAGGQTTTPYLAELVATSLVIASATPYIDKEYTAWFRAQLADIGRLTGYGIMEFVAASNRFKL